MTAFTDEQIKREEFRRHLERSSRRNGRYRALQLVVRGMALLVMLAFATAFGWYVVPVIPISVFLVAGFGAGALMLLLITRHGTYRRLPPPQ